MTPSPDAIRAEGDSRLEVELLEARPIQDAMKRLERLLEKEGGRLGTRRSLLARALRLTPEVMPSVFEVINDCRAALSVEQPLEAYIYPGSEFNAAAVKPEDGRLFLMFSSGLIEAFSAIELRFVVGHELGHHIYEHHKIPIGILLQANPPMIDAALALKIRAWQRYAEISCDRAGLVCAGELKGASIALFKLASGLKTAPDNAGIAAFLEQARDLYAESDKASTDRAPHQDWFSSHPFSPLRLRAAELFCDSVLFKPEGSPVDVLESAVHDLMALMEPGYLKEKSEGAEAMRRLLFAAGLIIADISGGQITEAELDAMQSLLGPGATSVKFDVAALRGVLDERIAAVKKLEGPGRRAQLIRDLCVVALADSRPREEERLFILEIAQKLEVSRMIPEQALSESVELD